MKETQTRVVTSFPVLGLLGAVLTVLKVLGKITLAWKWVLAPFWIPAAIGIGIVLACLGIALVAVLID